MPLGGKISLTESGRLQNDLRFISKLIEVYFHTKKRVCGSAAHSNIHHVVGHKSATDSQAAVVQRRCSLTQREHRKVLKPTL
jgi:hypothetical protein